MLIQPFIDRSSYHYWFWRGFIPFLVTSDHCFPQAVLYNVVPLARMFLMSHMYKGALGLFPSTHSNSLICIIYCVCSNRNWKRIFFRLICTGRLPLTLCAAKHLYLGNPELPIKNVHFLSSFAHQTIWRHHHLTKIKYRKLGYLCHMSL